MDKLKSRDCSKFKSTTTKMVIFNWCPPKKWKKAWPLRYVFLYQHRSNFSIWNARWSQLVLVVLDKSTGNRKMKRDLKIFPNRGAKIYPEAPSFKRLSLERRTRTSLKTSLNSPGGECKMKSDAIRTFSPLLIGSSAMVSRPNYSFFFTINAGDPQAIITGQDWKIRKIGSDLSQS